MVRKWELGAWTRSIRWISKIGTVKMPNMQRYHWHSVPLIALAVGIVLTVSARAASLPSSSTRVTGVFLGRPLEEVLGTIGESTGVSLAAGRGLAAQRVTLVARDEELSRLSAGLKDLLSAGTQAPVLWRTEEGQWVLEESVNRRKLREQLLSQRLQKYGALLAGAFQRFQASGGIPQLLAEGDQGFNRRVNTAFLSLIQPESREALLSGKPVVLDPGFLPRDGRELLRRFMETSSPNALARYADRVDGFRLAFLLSANPSDSKGVQLVRSIITPDGFCMFRSSVLTMPGAGRLPFVGPPFSLPRADPNDTSRRVTLRLPDPGGAAARMGTVWLGLDQCLSLLGRQVGLTIVADGYLRSPRQFPAGLEIKDYPLHQLLKVLCRTWGCEWRFQQPGEKLLLVRSRSWWLEDATDVPEPVLQRFRGSLGTGREGTLEDLLAFAELDKAQVHKLIETGICPQANGIIQPGWYNSGGVQPCLRFINRLAPPLRARALSGAGLPLKEAPAALVQEWLEPTLVGEVGSVTAEEQSDLILSFVLKQGGDNPFGRFELRVRSAGRSKADWRQFVQPPSTVRDPTMQLMPERKDGAGSSGR